MEGTDKIAEFKLYFEVIPKITEIVKATIKE